MKKIKQKVVEPIDDADSKVLVRGRFVDAGWPPADAEWLAELCLDVLSTQSEATTGSEFARERNIDLVARSWKDASPLGERQMALLRAYARLINCGGKGARLDKVLAPTPNGGLIASTSAGRKKIADTFRARDADFERALVIGGWPADFSESDLCACQAECLNGVVPAKVEVPEIHQFMRALVLDANLDLGSVLDVGQLVASGARRTGPDPAVPLRVPMPRPDYTKSEPPTPRSLRSWLIAIGPDALRPLPRLLDSSPNDGWRAALAFGIQEAVEQWLFFVSGHWTYFEHVGVPLAHAIRPTFEHLERVCIERTSSEGRLRQAWLWFGLCVSRADSSSLDDGQLERLVRAANEELARLRPLLSRATPRVSGALAFGQGRGLLPEGEKRTPWEEFEWESELFETSVSLLYHIGGVWAGMKPLLLALRSLRAPAVASDLRYWFENHDQSPGRVAGPMEQPPETWSIVPASMINLFHAYVGREQEEDPTLDELRGQLAAFCLRGLADRWSADERRSAERDGRERTDDDMLERSPDWRYCLVRAAMALHVNPEGKAHRLLHAASSFDPDPDVREVANEAYEKIRRARGLPDDVSPRRSVMTALWWIRQAHLLALGVEIDADGAQRTRAKELTRTKDLENSERRRR